MAQPHNPPPLPEDPIPLVRRRAGPLARPAVGGESSLFERWSEADVILDARIDAVRTWTHDVPPGAARMHVDWCIASLREVRECLGELRTVVASAGADERIPKDSPLVRYVTEAYVWAGDVLEDVSAFVRQLRRQDPAPTKPALGSIDGASDYVVEFLDPLQRRIERSLAELRADPALRQVPQLLARLRAAIGMISWSPCTSV